MHTSRLIKVLVACSGLTLLAACDCPDDPDDNLTMGSDGVCKLDPAKNKKNCDALGAALTTAVSGTTTKEACNQAVTGVKGKNCVADPTAMPPEKGGPQRRLDARTQCDAKPAAAAVPGDNTGNGAGSSNMDTDAETAVGTSGAPN
jgi:hypothetical protein